MATKDLHHRLTADPRNFERGFKSAEKSARALERALAEQERRQERVNQAMARSGRSVAAFGVALAAGLALSAREAVKWESAWAGVLKTVEGTPEQMAALEDQIRGLTEILPATHQEIAAVAEAAGQLGVAREDIADFTKTMIDLGVTTDLTAEEAATALARLMNIMQTSAGDVDRLGAALVDLGNNGASTEREISEMALRIAGAGNTIGLSEQQVLGFASALSNVGIAAEAGGTSISKVFLEVDRAVSAGGEQLATFARVAGVSADQFTAAYEHDAGEAIARFITGLGRVQESGGDVNAVLAELGLTEIRVSDALRRLSGSGDNLTDSLRTSNRAWDENTALVEEAERRYGTTEQQMRIAINAVRDLAIDVGGLLLPALGEMAKTLGGMARFFGDLPTPVKETAAALGVVAAAVALTGGAALIAVPRIAQFKTNLDTIAMTAPRTAAALGRVTGFLFGPWGAALGAATIGLGIFAAKQGEARARVEEHTEALDAQTGMLTDANRVLTAHNLAQIEATKFWEFGSDRAFDFSDALERMNIEMSTAVDAAHDNADALAVLNDVHAEAKARVDELSGGIALWGTEARNRRDEAEDDLEAIEEVIEAVTGERDRVREAGEMHRFHRDRTQEDTDATTDFAGEVETATNKIREHADALKEQTDPLFALFQATQRVDDAQAKYNETLDDTESTQADVDAAAVDLADAVLGLQGAAGDAAGMFGGELTPAMRDTLESADLTAEQIAAVEDAFADATAAGDEFAKNYEATASFDVGPAAASLARLNREMAAMPGFGGAEVRHSGGMAGTGSLRRLASDEVPTILQRGEFVSTRAATQQNLAALQAANAGARLSVAGGSSAGGSVSLAPQFAVRVFVGDREIRDVVRVEVDQEIAGMHRAYVTGTGLAR